MQDILKSKIFINFFLVITLASLIFFFSFDKNYQSEITILLVPKNEVTATNSEQITNNAKQIIYSLDFYNSLIDSKESFVSEDFSLSPQEKKKDWNKKIEVEKVKNTTVLKIFAFDKDKTKAEKLSEQIARQISDAMSEIYNIKSELQIRIIDSPFVHSNFNFSFSSLLISFLIGIGGGLLAYLIANSFSFIEIPLDFKFEQKITEIKKEEKFSILPEEDYFSEKISNPKINPSISSKKSAAPENLPIADFSNLSFQDEAKDSKKEIAEILEKAHTPKNTGVREATPEEVKERLNRLLRGEM